MAAVRDVTVDGCTPEDRAVLATAFVTPHAATRYRSKVRKVHPNEAVQSITAGIRDRAVRVRDRGGHPDQPRRVDVDVEAPGERWVARIVHDPTRGNLVVETILEHRDDWDHWPAPSGGHGDGMWVTSMRLTDSKWVTDSVRDVCTMHRRVLDMVEHHPEGPGRVLWAAPHRGTLTIRSSRPVSATPSEWAAEVTHRQWEIPDRAGWWKGTMVVNPVRDSKAREATSRAGKGRGRSLTLLRSDPDLHAWLHRKLPGAELMSVDVLRAWTDRGHRGGTRLTERALLLAVMVDVDDPGPLAESLTAGLGRGKAWGRGLSLWAPAL